MARSRTSSSRSFIAGKEDEDHAAWIEEFNGRRRAPGVAGGSGYRAAVPPVALSSLAAAASYPLATASAYAVRTPRDARRQRHRRAEREQVAGEPLAGRCRRAAGPDGTDTLPDLPPTTQFPFTG